MSRFGELLGHSANEELAPKVDSLAEQEPQRARNENGHFIADDPSTPENEAWVGGVAPKKTKKRSSKKK